MLRRQKALKRRLLHANVDFGRVQELLEQANRDSQAPVAQEWGDKPLSELIAHIVAKHHGYVRKETPRIQALLTKVCSKHGPIHPEIGEIDQLFSAVSQELSTHMLKEEQVLFPYIGRMENAVQSWAADPTCIFRNSQAAHREYDRRA